MQAIEDIKRVHVRNATEADRVKISRTQRVATAIIYCGRAMPGMAGSELGNPYKADSKLENIRNYKHWLWDRMHRNDPKVWKALHDIVVKAMIADSLGEDCYLACWCHPTDPCHCDIILLALKWAVKEHPRTVQLVKALHDTMDADEDQYRMDLTELTGEQVTDELCGMKDLECHLQGYEHIDMHLRMRHGHLRVIAGLEFDKRVRYTQQRRILQGEKK